MARRGDELREHILKAAKDVFLEVGYERQASMDEVAAPGRRRSDRCTRTSRARTSCSSRSSTSCAELYLVRLQTPDAYSDDTAKAVVSFCGRFLQLLLWRPALRTCRLSIAEAERIPEASAYYYDAIFATTNERLAVFLPRAVRPHRTRRAPSSRVKLLGHAVYPRCSVRCSVSSGRRKQHDPREPVRQRPTIDASSAAST